MKIKYKHIIIVWLAFASFMSVIMFLCHPAYNKSYGYFNAFRWEFAFALTWIPATRFVLYIADKFNLTKKTAFKNGIILFLIGIVLTSTQCFLHGIMIYFLSPEIKEYSKNVILGSFFYNIDKMIVIYCVLIVLQHAINYYRQFQEKELKASKLETELAQAQMQALKMQLHPHFLFNTLNAIVTLVHKDPDTAEQMIVRLSDFLRLTLKSSGKQMVTLKEEIEFAKAYLEIEQVRFQDRLSVTIALQDDLYNAEVPNLLLQPLVENAIKHGITPYTSKGTIVISAARVNGTLNISVADNGSQNSLPDFNKIKEGVGLSNTRARLDRLFGTKASLTLQSAKPCGAEVMVSLPYCIRDYHE